MDNKNSTGLKVLIAVSIVVFAVLYVVLLSVLVGKEIQAKTFSIQTVAYLCIAIFVPLFFLLALKKVNKD